MSAGLNCAHGVTPSELLTKTVSIPAARAGKAIASGSPPLLGTCQIHIPSPRNTAGSGPPTVAGARTTGAGRTTRRITRERRPARSVTRTEIVPAFVPAGTRTTQPAEERRSFVASAPRDQRKLTRIPALRLRPRSWTCLPICTCGRARHWAFVAGTQSRPLSSGGRVRAMAPEGASAPASMLATTTTTVAATGPSLGIGPENHRGRPKSRRPAQRGSGSSIPSTQFTTLTTIAASAAAPNERRSKSVSQSVM